MVLGESLGCGCAWQAKKPGSEETWASGLSGVRSSAEGAGLGLSPMVADRISSVTLMGGGHGS